MKNKQIIIISLVLTAFLVLASFAVSADSDHSQATQKILDEIDSEKSSQEEVSKNESQEKKEETENESEQNEEDVKEEKNKDESEEKEKDQEPLVSTVFFETDIREALNEVAMQTGVNIIYDETVVGTVTLDLKEVPLEKALEMMCISGGYSYRKVDDYYLVGLPSPESPMFEELTVTETIELDYIEAAEAVELLPPFYSDFVSTSDSEENEQILTISAPEAIIKEFKNDLKEIDTPDREIMVEIIVTEVSSEVIEEYGSDLFGLTTESGSEMESMEYDGSSFLFEAADSAGQIMAELKALEEKEKAEIRANPSIRVSDGESANLFIGEERVLILERDEADDILEEVEIGVAMEVTPELLGDQQIKMNIAPEVSSFSEERDQQLIVRRSELQSVVRAENEETITMAGMTLNEVMDYESAVPVLGDIPLVRWLFREETEGQGERELLVLVTPRIISE
ncbi:MAG: hypothetical protein ACLFQ4_09410 [Halanaerobium sp.]